MRAGELDRLLETCLDRLSLTSAALRRGKVRDVIDLGSELLIVTTDRISAFDRVLTTIPCKGEVLNTISLHWFHAAQDIVSHHVREEISPRTIRAVSAKVLPVEVVIRGYLTGSAWRDYQKGSTISGIELPAGMKFNQRFEHPLLTPSTKEMGGGHDLPISREEILSSGLVPRPIWEQVEEASQALFRRGTEMAARQGLILVDTKYEFGLRDGKLLLVDELHTPDSSRYWYADTYPSRFAEGAAQRELDKEYLRQWLLARHWSGDGAPPEIPADVRVQVAQKYIDAWETITGREFSPHARPEKEETALVAARMPAAS
jgi:phosphoribosylaminoimidazole-succinocarboxamide synthase